MLQFIVGMSHGWQYATAQWPSKDHVKSLKGKVLCGGISQGQHILQLKGEGKQSIRTTGSDSLTISVSMNQCQKWQKKETSIETFAIIDRSEIFFN